MPVSVEDFNHPLTFIIFMLLALWGMAALLTHAFKRLGWNGPAAFMQTP